MAETLSPITPKDVVVAWYKLVSSTRRYTFEGIIHGMTGHNIDTAKKAIQDALNLGFLDYNPDFVPSLHWQLTEKGFAILQRAYPKKDLSHLGDLLLRKETLENTSQETSGDNADTQAPSKFDMGEISAVNNFIQGIISKEHRITCISGSLVYLASLLRETTQTGNEAILKDLETLLNKWSEDRVQSNSLNINIVVNNRLNECIQDIRSIINRYKGNQQ